jgi:hypothetical protein
VKCANKISILPALAFSLDMQVPPPLLSLSSSQILKSPTLTPKHRFTKTHMSFGVNEVLLSSVLGAVVFSLFAAQPLVIVGVTGPITVFNYTVYDIMVPTGTNYFAFMALIGLYVRFFSLSLTNPTHLFTSPCLFKARSKQQKEMQLTWDVADGH